jgi:RHS repeat-associated protein
MALIPDIQGSIIATLDSATASLVKAGYLPYGKSASPPSAFGYTGQRIDPETNGLYYYRTRHYSPLLGRFLQTDPSGTKGGVNLYAYAKNDPLNLVDISGRAPDAPSSGVSSAANFNFSEVDTSEDGEGEIAWNPISANVGPLGNPNDINTPASTFRSGTYTQATLSEDQTLFRVTSDIGNPTGSYWTSTRPQGPLQSVIDSALDQSWGNTATQVITATVPSGTTIYQGFAAAQGGLVGGGNQIYIPNVNPNWIQR